MFCFLSQGDSHGTETQVSEITPRAPAAQDNQPHTEAEGCFRLRRNLAQECFQHPPRLHTLSGGVFQFQLCRLREYLRTNEEFQANEMMPLLLRAANRI